MKYTRRVYWIKNILPGALDVKLIIYPTSQTNPSDDFLGICDLVQDKKKSHIEIYLCAHSGLSEFVIAHECVHALAFAHCGPTAPKLGRDREEMIADAFGHYWKDYTKLVKKITKIVKEYKKEMNAG